MLKKNLYLYALDNFPLKYIEQKLIEPKKKKKKLWEKG